MMKHKFFSISLLLLTLPVFAAGISIPLCSSDIQVNQICAVQDFNLIHPTQFNYGKNYVKAKVASFLKNTPKYNQEYLNKRGPQNSVIGPDGQIYITDAHHHIMTFIQLSEMQKHPYTLHLKVVKRFPKTVSMKSFWRWMEDHNAAYLQDNKLTRAAEQLPQNFKQLSNDKYHSLAGWLAKEHWCFTGSKINYVEFFWANYFRKQAKTGKLKPYPDFDITLTGEKEKLKEYLTYIKSSNLCHSGSARTIIGYCSTTETCLKKNKQDGAAFNPL